MAGGKRVTSHSTTSSSNSRLSFSAGSKQTLHITADALPDGFKETIKQGLLVRVEAGTELKLLAIWGIESEDEVGSSVVIRDGHSLKKKVSWRPSCAGGEQLNASSIVFVPAHQYGTSRTDGMMWTSWWNPLDRGYHQFVLFNPLNREAQRCVRFREIFQNSGVATGLYCPKNEKDLERGVKFTYERGSVVQPPLAAFLESTQRLYILHQVESRGALETALSAVVPHPPYTVTDTCVMPFSWASGCPFASICSRSNASFGDVVVLVTNRLHSIVFRVGQQVLQPARTFRPRDFVDVAKSPSQALEVCIRWYCAEVRDHVILPEFFRDPTTEKDISEPRRMGSQAQPSLWASKPSHHNNFNSSGASQRSSSLASTVPQRIRERGPSVESRVASLEHNWEAPTPGERSAAPRATGGGVITEPPISRVLIRAVEALARMNQCMLATRYFQRWATKTLKHPNLCLDGWPGNSHTAVAIVPLSLLLMVSQQAPHISNFLGHCSGSGVEVWLVYEEGFELPPFLEGIKALDSRRAIGQMIAVPSLREAPVRQNLYLRHLHHQSVLWVMPSVAWMLHVTPLGRNDAHASTTFSPCAARLFCPLLRSGTFHKDFSQGAASFIQRLGELIRACRRLHTGNNLEHLWNAMSEPEVTSMLCTTKECTSNGKGFVDLLTVSL